MIRPAIIFVAAATAIFLAGCGSDQKASTRSPAAPEPGLSNGSVDHAPIDSGTSGLPPSPPPTSPSTAGPAASPPAAPPATIPYAQPVPGKPGFVTSPYSPEAGIVDVRGFPPGTEVKDPYTQRVFLVP